MSSFIVSTLSGKTIEGKCNGNEDAALWVNVFEGAKPRRGRCRHFSDISLTNTKSRLRANF
eukprot:1394282-Amorphochlora_amoeboformis.AAC.3